MPVHSLLLSVDSASDDKSCIDTIAIDTIFGPSVAAGKVQWEFD